MNRRLWHSLPTALASLLLVSFVLCLGLAVAWLPARWSALCILGGTALLMLVLRPQCTLCLLALAVPFGWMAEIRLGPVSPTAGDVLVVLLFAFWFAGMVSARRITIPHPPLLLPLLAFLGVMTLSTLAGTSLELSVKEIVKWVEVLVIYSFMASLGGGAVFSPQSQDPTGGSNADPAPRWAPLLTGTWVVWALISAGSVEALVGAYQFVRGIGPEGFVLFGRFMRAYGHFAQPNPFAGYLGLTIPLAYALTLEALTGHPIALHALRGDLRRILPEIVRVAAPVAALSIMVVAVLMSWSRGAWVGLAAALLVVTVARSRRALVGTLAVGLLPVYLLLIGGVRYLPPALVQRVSDFLPYASGIDVRTVQVTDANYALVERMAHWEAALSMFADHPWLGVGIGNYAAAYPRYAVGRWRDPLGHAHNYYLNIAAEAGIIGLGTYLALVVACLLHALSVVRHSRGYWRAVALGVLGVLVHLSVHNLFDNLYVHSMNIQLGLVLGLLAVAESSANGAPAHRD
jgi:putative inorganic carbon (HCO3(-)) transporter